MARRWLLGSLMLSLAMLTPLVVPAPRAWAGDDAPAAAPVDDKFVELVMADGRIIKAELISESATEYRVLAHLMEGFPAVETTFRKSNVKEIRRGVAIAGASTPTPKAPPASVDKPTESAEPKSAEGAAKLILTRVDGVVGFDFSPSPIRDFFEMVDKEFNDIGPDGHVVSEHRKDHIVIFRFNTETNVDAGIDGLFSIMAIKELLQEEILKGRRIVFWIEKGLNGAALLPMMSPEIYFTDRGMMYVTKDLEGLMQGDDVVIEKQISLRMGHAEGFPLLGGYNEVGPQMVRAMLRRTFEFWYKKVGDKVYASNETPPADEIEQWTMLSDNGTGDNKDDADNIMELLGNDLLWLNAERAYELGLSKGNANTLEDIAFHLGVGRNYEQVLKDGGEDLFRRWRGKLERALSLIHPGDQQRPRGELWKQFDKAGELDTVQAQLGRRKTSLEKIQSYFRLYKEVFDPNGEQYSQLDVEIEALRQQIMEANRQTNN